MSRYSGKFVLRVSPRVHQDLKKEATAKGISLNQLCSLRLSSRKTDSTSDIFEKLVKRLEIPIVGIILFGSAARGQRRASSDVDWLLVIDSSKKVTRSLYHKWDQVSREFPELENVEPQFVTLPRSARDAGGLWAEVAIEGRVQWQKTEAVSDVLRSLRQLMSEGVLQRKLSHGHPYWVWNLEKK